MVGTSDMYQLLPLWLNVNGNVKCCRNPATSLHLCAEVAICWLLQCISVFLLAIWVDVNFILIYFLVTTFSLSFLYTPDPDRSGVAVVSSVFHPWNIPVHYPPSIDLWLKCQLLKVCQSLAAIRACGIYSTHSNP